MQQSIQPRIARSKKVNRVSREKYGDGNANKSNQIQEYQKTNKPHDNHKRNRIDIPAETRPGSNNPSQYASNNERNSYDQNHDKTDNGKNNSCRNRQDN